MVLCPLIKAKIKEVETLDDTTRGSGDLDLQELNNN